MENQTWHRITRLSLCWEGQSSSCNCAPTSRGVVRTTKDHWIFVSLFQYPDPSLLAMPPGREADFRRSVDSGNLLAQDAVVASGSEENKSPLRPQIRTFPELRRLA